MHVSQRVYNPQTLKTHEEPYRIRLEQLRIIFGQSCRIFVTDPDGFGMRVGAGVVKLNPQTGIPTTVVEIQFVGHEPLGEQIIQEIRSHLASGKTEDLSMKC